MDKGVPVIKLHLDREDMNFGDVAAFMNFSGLSQPIEPYLKKLFEEMKKKPKSVTYYPEPSSAEHPPVTYYPMVVELEKAENGTIVRKESPYLKQKKVIEV